MLTEWAEVVAQDILRVCLGDALYGRVLFEEVDDVRFGNGGSGLIEEDAGDKDAELETCELEIEYRNVVCPT